MLRENAAASGRSGDRDRVRGEEHGDLPHDLLWMKEQQSKRSDTHTTHNAGNAHPSSGDDFTSENDNPNHSNIASKHRYQLRKNKPKTQYADLNEDITKEINSAMNKELDRAIDAEIDKHLLGSKGSRSRKHLGISASSAGESEGSLGFDLSSLRVDSEELSTAVTQAVKSSIRGRGRSEESSRGRDRERQGADHNYTENSTDRSDRKQHKQQRRRKTEPVWTVVGSEGNKPVGGREHAPRKDTHTGKPIYHPDSTPA